MKLFLYLSLFSGITALVANPKGIQPIFGEATCSFPDTHTMEITTGKDTILQWQSFSIGQEETTRFIMPDSHSRVLNRVMGGNLSEILGTLEANGEVYLINPNGVLVGERASVNTTSFIGSSFDVLNEDFLQGNARFCQKSAGNVINLGAITAQNGFVYLIGNHVEHAGTIESFATEERNGRIFLTGGTVHLLGETVALNNHAYVNASGDNGGGNILIGGDYQGANPDILNASVVYVDPTVRIEANALEEGNGGRVIVWADEFNAFYGQISVQGGKTQGDGGFAEVSCKNKLAYHGLTNTLAPFGKRGTLLLDPSTITISTDTTTTNIEFGASCGTDTYCSNDDMDGTLNNTDLSFQLLFSDVIVSSTGDIDVTASVSGASALTLTAEGDINITGGSSASDLVAISVATLTINANGNVTIQGGSDTATFVSLDSSATSMSGNSIILTAGTGGTSFVSISAYDTDLTLSAQSDIIMTGSDTGTVSGINLLTTNGLLTLSADAGDIILNAGNQTSSGILVYAGAELSVTAGTNLILTSSASSSSVILASGDSTLTATTMDLSASSVFQQSSITNNTGNFTINSNDINLNSFSNITLSSGSSGDFTLTTTGDLLITSGSMINNQSSGMATNIIVDGTLTLEGLGGDAIISSYTSNFNLTSLTDLVLTASSDGAAMITTVSPVTVIDVDRNITLTGDPATLHAASIVSNDGSLTITAGNTISLRDYSIVEISYSNGVLTLNSGENFTAQNHVIIDHLNLGSLVFNVGNAATFSAGADGFVRVYSPSTLDFYIAGDLLVSSSSTNSLSISSNDTMTIQALSMNMTGYDSTHIVNLTNSSGDISCTTVTDLKLNQNAQINLTDGPGQILLTSGSNFLLADNSFIQSSSTGTLTIEAGAFLTLDASDGYAVIQSMNADISVSSANDITMTASSNGSPQLIAFSGLSVLSQANITTTGDSTFPAVITSFHGPMTLTAALDVSLQSNTNVTISSDTFPLSIEAVQGNFSIAESFILQSDGDITITAGDNVSFDATSLISGSGNIVLIIDNNDPSSPDIGPGAFVFPDGASIGTGTDKYLRIYTATRDQNMIGGSAVINGLAYSPSPEFLDSDQEFWGVYYPDVPAGTPSAPYPDGTNFYTIYYKNDGMPPQPLPPPPPAPAP